MWCAHSSVLVTEPRTLLVGDAVLRILEEGFCNLLFLHYFPVGLGDLVDPLRWASHFAMPELQPLCDLFAVTLRSAAQEMGPMA